MEKYEIISIPIIVALTMLGSPFLGVFAAGFLIGFAGRRENKIKNIFSSMYRSFFFSTIGAVCSVAVVGGALYISLFIIETVRLYLSIPPITLGTLPLTKFFLVSFLSVSIILMLLSGIIGGLGGALGFYASNYLLSPIEHNPEKEENTSD